MSRDPAHDSASQSLVLLVGEVRIAEVISPADHSASRKKHWNTMKPQVLTKLIANSVPTLDAP